MNHAINYIVPTWNQIYEMLENQASKIQKNNYKPDLLIAISRGGLVPARILSDLLEFPALTTIKIEFYLGVNKTKTQPAITQELTVPVTNKNVLLIDDVADTGESLILAKKHISEKGAKEIKVATLYLKPKSQTMPDYFEAQTNDWIVFPWDIKETIRKIVEKHDSKREASKEISRLVRAGLPKNLAEKFLKEILQEANHASTL